MDYLLCDAQGDADQQHRVLELTLRSPKEIFPSIPGEIKNSVILKKALGSNGYLSTTKYILGWVMETDKGTMLLSFKHKTELLSLLNPTPPSLPHVAAWQ